MTSQVPAEFTVPPPGKSSLVKSPTMVPFDATSAPFPGNKRRPPLGVQ